jgi:hypothetical protein
MRFIISNGIDAPLNIPATDLAKRTDEVSAMRERSPDTFSIVDDAGKVIVPAKRSTAPAPLAVAVTLACDACGSVLSPDADRDQTLCATCRAPRPLPPAPPAPVSSDAAPVNVDAPTGPIVVVVDTPAPSFSTWTSTTVDATAKDRIDAQHASLRASGITGFGHKETGGNGPQYFANGTHTDTARMGAMKAEWEAMRPLHDVAKDLAARVRAERRCDVAMDSRAFGRSIRMDGKRIVAADGFALTERAIRGLLARIDSPALGYVLGLRERIADEVSKGDKRDLKCIESDRNEIVRTLAYECARCEEIPCKVRAREAPRDIFAFVSPSYANADAPESVDKLLASPLLSVTDLRGAVKYDPTSTAWELRASIWTPTPTDSMAVGEPFEGYASFRGRDNGTGRWSGGGGLTFIRCVNASVYTVDTARVSRIHRGDVLSEIDVAVDGAMTAISALCKAWGINREITLAPPEDSIDSAEWIAGLYRAMLRDDRDLVKVPLRGARETHVSGLTAAYAGERRDADRVTRADLAQGWTKYIQSLPMDVRAEGEARIGDWLARAVDARSTPMVPYRAA